MHPHGKGADKVCDSGFLRRLPGLIHGQPRCGDGDIGKDIAGKELAVLQHDTEPATQGAPVELLKVNVIIGDAALPGRKKAKQQLHESGFPAASLTHDGDILPRTYGQAQIIQDRRAILRVTEGDVVQLDPAA